MRLSFLLLLAGTGLLPAAVSRPNIVVIMADDLGFADLGCYGSEVETPHLDSLARQGLRFTQFANTAKCHSSRVSLLTGLYCGQAGDEKLSRGATIAEALAPAGYHTMMAGKWHLSRQPTDFGFDRYWGHLSGATNFFTGDDSFRLDGEKWSVPKELNGRPFYTTDAIGDFAIEFLDDHRRSAERERPFFLYLAFNAPHYPLQAPKDEVEKHLGRYDDGWDVIRGRRHRRQLDSGLLPAKWKLSPRPEHVPAWDTLSEKQKTWESRRMAVFAAMVEIMDRNVGRLIEHLKREGLYDNTLILFCSDNGACPFDRTRGRDKNPWDPESYWCYSTGWAHVGNTPFRLYKQNQHEGGTSSPLIIKNARSLGSGFGTDSTRDPTRRPTPGGEVTDQPAHLIDFMATCLEVAGADYPRQVGDRRIDPLQGKSLVPVIRGLRRDPHDALYFHFGTDRALRQGDWKLVSAKRGRWELYDLAQDPTELSDLAAKHPERVRRMSREWFHLARDVDRLPERKLQPVKDELVPLFGDQYPTADR